MNRPKRPPVWCVCYKKITFRPTKGTHRASKPIGHSKTRCSKHKNRRAATPRNNRRQARRGRPGWPILYVWQPLHRPPSPPPASDPAPSPADPADPVIDKECCGNIRLTHNFAEVLLWEAAPAANATSVVQITVYADPGNKDSITLTIEGEVARSADVCPGNTFSFVGQQVRKLYARMSAAGPSAYAEGKYIVSASLSV